MNTPVNIVNTNASPTGLPPHGRWLKSRSVLIGLYGGTPRCSLSHPDGFEAVGGDGRLSVLGGAGDASLVRWIS